MKSTRGQVLRDFIGHTMTVDLESPVLHAFWNDRARAWVLMNRGTPVAIYGERPDGSRYRAVLSFNRELGREINGVCSDVFRNWIASEPEYLNMSMQTVALSQHSGVGLVFGRCIAGDYWTVQLHTIPTFTGPDGTWR